MASNKALQAKDKGNKLFKDGQLAESVKLYKEAEKLDLNNAVYPSNLSAALYELGDYAGCMNAVLRSWALKPSNDLALKLSTRLAKTLSQGVQDGCINPSVVQQNLLVIKELEATSLTDDSDNAQAWKLWKSIRQGLEHHGDLSYEAKVRLSKMPIYKGMPIWQFGTDPIVSLPSGWGPEYDDPINFRSLSKEQLAQLSFLVAGVGDGRHGFGTIIGLGKAHAKLNASQKKDMKAHVTFLDIHFAIIARNLVFFLLIDELMSEDLDPQTRIETQATLVYLFVCRDAESRLLEQPPRLPSWIHVDKNSIKPIIQALDFWRNDQKITASNVLKGLKYASAADNIRGLIESDYPGVRESMQGHREDAERVLAHISDSELVKLAHNMGWPKGQHIKDLRKMLTSKKEEVVNMMMLSKFDKNITLGLTPEAEWYRRVLAFVPPSELLDRHPGFEYFKESLGVDATHLQDGKHKTVRTSVLKTWKPNITILDGTQEGCMSMDLDAFSCVQEIALFNEKNGLKDENTQRQTESPTFSYLATFFDAIELLCGEVNSELSKIRSGTDSRPKDFPKKFTRVWLSNIPDYTHGTLSTAIYVLPALQDNTDFAAASSNCMFNSPVWKTDDEFCYNYTLLLPRDLERYLGIRTLNGKAVHDVLTLASHPLPRPLTALASREYLQSWLARLLLSFVWPGSAQVRPNTIKLPSNLVSFIRLLVELRHIGYPSHWLSDFLHAVLNGTLQIDNAVYQGKLPRPVTDLHKRVAVHRVRLDPWYAEFETILASARHGLPFALQLPEGFATSVDDVGLFRATVAPNMLFSSPMVALPKNDSVIALLFYKSQAELHPRSVDYFIADLPAIVDGRANPPRGTFHVFTTQEFVDLSKREVRWKMPKTLAAKMKRERWLMVLFRMDFHCTTTEPCPASAWQNVDVPI
ncbi:hypothetical protein BDZ97DRAFT_1906448 [Flammula alnicola]|nr:hypothetical protein BDZ97DRAFT_1906448 [Flammula alnicola]